MLELYWKIKKCWKEAIFTTAWLKMLKEKWFWCHKISDWWIWLKPFDWLIQSNISNYYFEVKRISWNTFNFKQIRINQWTSFHKISNLENKCEIYEKNPKELNNKSCLLVIFKKDTSDFIIIPFCEIAYLSPEWSIVIDFKNKIFKSQ